MKLLFIDLVPSKAFQTTVSSHGFSLLNLNAIPTETLQDKVEMAICLLSDVKELNNRGKVTVPNCEIPTNPFISSNLPFNSEKGVR